ncbi:MAG: hypothetical protein M3162_04985 [Thermoproteota archaeon]|nr:hypothetical protein [Thermoproteota archaeon]
MRDDKIFITHYQKKYMTSANNNELENKKNILFFKYKSLQDMLKIILYTSQSPIGMMPMLYRINKNNTDILFIQTGSIGGAVIHYIIPTEKIEKKFIQLKRLTGEYHIVENLGTDTLSLYIPIIELEDANIQFPIL